MFQAIPELLALSERPEPVQELRREPEERPGREQAQVARRVLEPGPGPVGHRARAVQQGLPRAGRVAQADWARAGRS